MRLTGLAIDGFGHFRDAALRDLPPGLILFLGDNEAGKSTLLGFIRAVLFGFPRKNANEPDYPPLAGGRHGGRLLAVTDAGEPCVIERGPGRSAGLVTVRVGGEPAGSEEALARLLGGTTRELYKNIYAFSLSELQALDTLQTENIRGAIYGAAAGAAMLALPRAGADLRAKQETLFLPRGSKPAINELLHKLEGVRRQLTQAKEQAGQYDALHQQLRRAEEEMAALAQGAKRLNGEQAKTLSRLTVWEDWIELCRCEAELEDLPAAIEAFPDEGLRRLEDLLRERRDGEQRLGERESARASLAREMESLTVNAGLLAQAEAVQMLADGRLRYLEAREKLPALVREREALAREIQVQLTGLGPDWSEARALAIDRSLFTREEIRARQGRMNEMETALAAARQIEGQREADGEKARSEAEEARAAIGEANEPGGAEDEKLIEDLRQRRKQFADVIPDLPRVEEELREASERVAQLVRDINPHWGDDDVQRFDVSLPAQQKIQDFEARIEEAQRAVASARATRNAAEQTREEVKAREDAALRAWNAVPPPAADREALDRRHKTALSLRGALGEREAHAREERHLRERLKDKQEAGRAEKALATPPAPAEKTGLLLAGVSLAAVIVLFAFGQTAAACLAMIAAAYFVYHHFAQRRAAARRAEAESRARREAEAAATEQVAAIERELAQQAGLRGATDEQIARLARELGLERPETLTGSDVDAIESRTQEERLMLERWTRMGEAAQEAELEARRAERIEENARRDQLLRETELASLYEQWEEHARKLGLSPNVSPRTASLIFSKIEAAKRELRAVADKQRRIRQMHEARQRYRALAGRIPALAAFCELEDSELLSCVDAFFEELRRRKDNEKERALALRTLEEKTRRAAEAETARGEARARREALEDERTEDRRAWTEWLAARGLAADLSPETALEAFGLIDRCAEKITQRDERERAIQEQNRRLEAYEAEAARLFAALGQPMAALGRPMLETERLAVAVEALAAELAATRENDLRRREMARGLATLDGEIDQARARVAQVQEDISRLIEAAGAADEEAFREHGRLDARRRERAGKIAETQRNLLKITGECDLDALRAELAAATREALETRKEELTRQIEEMAAETETLRDQAADLRQALNRLQSADDIARHRAEEERLLAEIRELGREWARAALAEYLLKKAREKFEKEHQPRVIRDAGAFFSRITDGRYAEVVAPMGEDTIEIVNADGERKRPEQLSRGAAEQLYLAIRFGYIRHRSASGERLPVIMDDILVNFDPARAARAAAAILELARDHQVLFFTCHPQTAGIFQSLDGDVPMIRIDGGRFGSCAEG